MDPTAGMGGRGGEVEPADPGLGAPPPGNGPEDQLLVELGGAAVDRSPDQVGVAGLELTWTEHPPGEHPLAEAGGHPLDLVLHAVGEALTVVGVPHPADRAADPSGVVHAPAAARGL